VWWGGKQPWTPDAAVLDHLPTQLECENARAVVMAEHAAAVAAQKRQAAEEAAWTNLLNINPTLPAIQVTSAPKMPIPDPNSRQKYGETPAQFLKRMAEDRTRRIASESASQRQTRENRERVQGSHQCPGTSSKAPHVFYWEPDVDTGIRMHTHGSLAPLSSNFGMVIPTDSEFLMGTITSGMFALNLILTPNIPIVTI